jgi:hypothetical protein
LSEGKLTNLELLSFLVVFAFPNASKIGFVCTIWSSSEAFFDAFFFPSFAPTIAK